MGVTGRGHIISGARRRGELCRRGRVAQRGFKPGTDGTGRAAASASPDGACVTRGRQDASRRRSRPPRPGPRWRGGRPQVQPRHLRAAPSSDGGSRAAARRGLRSLPAGTGKATSSRGGKSSGRSRSERGSKSVSCLAGGKGSELSARRWRSCLKAAWFGRSPERKGRVSASAARAGWKAGCELCSRGGGRWALPS